MSLQDSWTLRNSVITQLTRLLCLEKTIQSVEPPRIKPDPPGWKLSFLAAPIFHHMKLKKCIAT